VSRGSYARQAGINDDTNNDKKINKIGNNDFNEPHINALNTEQPIIDNNDNKIIKNNRQSTIDDDLDLKKIQERRGT